MGPQVQAPAQGTWISEKGDEITVAKGIVRPCLRNPYTGEAEEESSCLEAAFGKQLNGNGTFYQLGKVGRNRCSLAYQTILFSSKNPAVTIQHDNDRFKNITALDFLSQEDKIKVEHGVSPALLMEQAAPWDAFRQFKATGVRATVYGSYLVPINSAAALEKMPKIYDIVLNGALSNHQAPCFMLLPSSALSLAGQLGVEPHELIGRYFLIHRDPSLPDATSLYPALYCGILEWDNKNIHDSYGFILNPLDSFWLAAGGDFDGDAAACYQPTEWLLPYGSTGRPDFRTKGTKYLSTEVKEQIIEASANTVTGLLGTTILSAMRLIERDINSLRPQLAGVAQAAVQAKKHTVDTDLVSAFDKTIKNRVQQENTYCVFISDYINIIKNALGIDAKVKAWRNLVQAVEQGFWSNGTKIEKALVERVLILNELYNDVEFFRQLREATFPAILRDAAKAKCSTPIKLAVSTLAQKYRDLTMRVFEYGEYELEDNDNKEGGKAFLLDQLQTVRNQFQLACITGKILGQQFSSTDVQIGMIAYGPIRLAAQFASAAVFKTLGINTSRCIVQLCDHGWNDGTYKIEDLKPIPSCKTEFNLFIQGKTEVTLQVIGQAPRSTRVLLTS